MLSVKRRILSLSEALVSVSEFYQYVPGSSIVHKMSLALKVALWIGLALASLSINEPWVATTAVIISVVLYLLSGMGLRRLAKDVSFSAIAGAAILASYYILGEPLMVGAVNALRVVVVFFPFSIITRTTTISQFTYSFRKILPQRLALALAIAVRFVPYFTRELAEVVSVQRSRGLRTSLRTATSHEGFRYIGIPLTVRAVRSAEVIAMSVELRAFGARPCRTYLQDASKAKRYNEGDWHE